MANSNNDFVQGLFVNQVETQYGTIDKLSFKADQFIEYLNANKNDKGYVNIDLLSKRDGGKYAKLNEYKPKGQPASNNNGGDDGDLPF